MFINSMNLAAFKIAITLITAINGQAHTEKLVTRADSVTGFYDYNYSGQSVPLPSSFKGACNDLAQADQHKISSIKVIPDTNCVFYAEKNCTGRSFGVVQDIPDFKPLNFNDIISSFNCYAVVATVEDPNCPVDV
ncbi:hypothetical protein ONZ45_g3057 [Pleurotus djamor]|nr:hypothetical protein ONZ45_g3057 [Pleurotus djamor]